MTAIVDFKDWIGAPFTPSAGVNEDMSCWDFCVQAAKRLGFELPLLPQDMVPVGRPHLGSVVLFKYGTAWHCGLLWPDCLHFIHAFPKSPGDKDLYCHMDRLTLPPWRGMVEGYYGAS